MVRRKQHIVAALHLVVSIISKIIAYNESIPCMFSVENTIGFAWTIVFFHQFCD